MENSIKSDGTEIVSWDEAFSRKEKLEKLRDALNTNYIGLNLKNLNYEDLKKEVEGELAKVTKLCKNYRFHLT